MTVTYSLDVATSSFWSLYKLLFRWKGSIWKSVWHDLLLWSSLYAILSILYRLFMSDHQREFFEDICVFFNTYSEFIPMTFMLGFYVSTVYSRWWEIFQNVGWIDTPALLVAANISGIDDQTRILRRNIVRYLVLTQALVFRDVSACVKKRFPTMNHLVTAGLMSLAEKEEFDKIDSPHIKYWQPMHWVFSLVKKAKDQGKMSEIVYVDMLEKMRQFRVNVLNLTLFDWVSVPLGYTQVVHLAVRSYFLIALLGRQYLNTAREIPMHKTVDLYIPIMTILQFLFFVGWMKVAEVLLNPLGEDDDDFECNYILDRNLQVGFAIVDEAYTNVPPQEKDSFWDVLIPEPLYTTESAARPVNPAIGSCVEMTTDFDRSLDDEAIMLRPHRRSLHNKTLAWDHRSEVIVPVMRTRKNGSVCTSLDNISIGRPTSRLRDFIKKMNRSKFEHSLPTRIQRSSRSNSIVSSYPSISRHDSFCSVTPSVMSTECQTEDTEMTIPSDLTSKQNDTSWKVDELLPVIMEADERKETNLVRGSKGSSSEEEKERDNG